MMCSDNTSSKLQKGMTFLELLRDKKIIIPKIQRDYAQGRIDPKTNDIREGFLSEIKECLIEENGKPLILDFVYGSTHDNLLFTPLDGQQRLTTLFLLHWYFASSDDLECLRDKYDNSLYSRFSYETRISSKDFCDAIVKIPFSTIKDKKILLKKKLQSKQDQADNEKVNLSVIIKDQPWFMWNWRKDPTIKAILVMLDEMDLKFKEVEEESRIKIWEKLEGGILQFHLLPLEEFNLSNELYVKMNARGKDLSPFDILKSTLEEQMLLNSVSEETQSEWRNNIDSNWIDIFWNTLAKPYMDEDTSAEDQLEYVDSVEDGYLQFLMRLISFYLVQKDNCIDFNLGDFKQYLPAKCTGENTLESIRTYSVQTENLLGLMPFLCKAKFFNEIFFKYIINSFKIFIYEDELGKHQASELIEGILFEGKSKTLFDAIITRETPYDTLVQFFSLMEFLKYFDAKKIFKNENLKMELNSWMRIIRNLSTNSNTYIYNNFNDYLRSLNSITKWAREVYGIKIEKTIIEYFIFQEKLEGFQGNQLEEEKIKAKLLSSTTEEIAWQQAIRTSEEHPYLTGQIRFLLEWSKVNDSYDLHKFNVYFENFCSIFNKEGDGLREEMTKNHVFRNALLVNSDCYLFNKNFIKDTSKDRDSSWKRYLRETQKSINIKKLLDGWDQSNEIAQYCSEIIIRTPVSDWRKYFIAKPSLYDTLRDAKIENWFLPNNEICLLSKTRWTSYHKELKTYYWFLIYKTSESSDDKYEESTSERGLVSAIFRGVNGMEFSVKFIPHDDPTNNPGQYIVCSNFDPLERNERQIGENSRWSKNFNTNDEDAVEDLIRTLIKIIRN